MSRINLTVGGGCADRVITEADILLRKYRDRTGCDYLDYVSTTPLQVVVPEDLAVTLLVNSRVGWRAFHSLMVHGHTLQLGTLPQLPLEQTSNEERAVVAALIAHMTTLPGFGASVASKVLHKKRPALIPILDNHVIFGSYMKVTYPIKSEATILQALDWIAFDITRPENELVWPILQDIENKRTRIQLFDSVLWMYFNDSSTN